MAKAEVSCTVDGCNSPVRAMRLCSGHYQRFRAYGDPNGIAPRFQNASYNQERTCYYCDRVFYRTVRSARDAGTCCSRECGFHWAQIKRHAGKRRATFTVAKARCQACDKPFTNISGVAVYCSDGCRSTATKAYQRRRHAANREVRHCGCGAELGIAQRLCAVCGSAARKATKAIHRKARKLRLRGVRVEQVNPLKVLERDRWTCQLCGTKTPKRLRGTYDDRAPEVDHIIPIAQGGEHSYLNTQCACRRCNLAKSGSAKGQLRLFG
jgi:5-methylcytosine-specific restriction endonuclease McrA